MAKLKTKKCALKSCRAEFTPKKYWQKYHTPRCAWTAKNKANAALIKRALRSIERRDHNNDAA